jgi:putative phage-type endonuclease
MIYDVEQGTEEWLALRCGKVTASRVADATATVKSGEAAARRNYRAELVAELLTGIPTEQGFVSAAMRWGTEQEPNARFEYEMRFAPVQPVGFIVSDEFDKAGASPDGLVEDDGGIEIKCPNTATHIETVMNGKIAGNYRKQIDWNLFCSGRAWWDFVSYDPRIKDRRLQFTRIRVVRDEKRIAALVAEVREFWQSVEDQVAKLEKIAEGMA